MISQNPIFLLVTGDFNVKNNCITGEGNKIEPLTCSYGLRQLILILPIFSTTLLDVLT